MSTIDLRVKRLHEDAQLPTYGTDGAACFDLYALQCGVVTETKPEVFRTGLSFEVPDDHVMLVFSRSGHGFKSGIRLANCVGVIDSDYRGEVQVKLTADEIFSEFKITKGDRIAQAMIVPYPRVRLLEVEELSTTERGIGGFGSTGA